jgi:hypothetical protein
MVKRVTFFNRSRSTGVKIILGFVEFVLLLLVCFVIWILVPIQEIFPWEMLPPNAFSFFSLHTGGNSQFTQGVKQKIAESELGILKKTAARLFLPLFLPKRIVGIATLGMGSEEPEIIIIVSMRKTIRLMKTLDGVFDRLLFQSVPFKVQTESGHSIKSFAAAPNPLPLSAYSVMKNNIVLGSSLSTVMDSIRAYGDGASKDPSRGRLMPLLLQGSVQQDGFIFADNTAGAMSRIIQSLEEKYAYAAFPSIPSVSMIAGYISFLPEKMSGRILLYCNNSADIGDVRSDVKFIYGALRRKLKASGVEIKGDITVEGSSVEFLFQIPDILETVFSNPEKKIGEAL